MTDSVANVVQAAKSALLLLRSAPCTSVLLAEAIPDTDALNDACAWLNQRPPPPPPPQQRAERTPAPLGTLLGAPPPPLAATLCACPERMSLVLARLPAVLATLHLRELRPVLVKCFVALAAAVPLEGASQGAAQAATIFFSAVSSRSISGSVPTHSPVMPGKRGSPLAGVRIFSAIISL